MKLLWTALFLWAGIQLSAQSTQQLRGTIVDRVLKQPLAGATVSVSPANLNVITDESGNFRFSVPVGIYQLSVTYGGYHDIFLENIAVNAGKETVLNLNMEADILAEQEVTVKSTRRNRPINTMSVVSARAFSVEETQRYAASVNDPLRMAAGFPGVMAADDGNNSIVIRGNSPNGLLWRMEGLDIPNPNHFAVPGNSGGGVSILNAQVLSNSDFVTSAFAAEYGNALSGVFDIHLRKGNDEKREYTLQAGVLGLAAAAEGPFTKESKASYLISYRYSTLSLLNKMGVLGDFGATNFQDLSYNISVPTKTAGQFSLFGFGGLSDQLFNAKKDSVKWEYNSDRYSNKFYSNTGMTGITHQIPVSRKMTIVSALGYSKVGIRYDETFLEDSYEEKDSYTDDYRLSKWMLTSSTQYKFNNRLNMRTGIIATAIRYKFFRENPQHQGDPLEITVDARGKTGTQQIYSEWQYQLSPALSFNGGIHFLRLSLNASRSLEPRFSASWKINGRNSLSMGFGLHSQLQTMSLYFAQQPGPGNNAALPNKNLGLSKARHFVLSYNRQLHPYWQLKTELYYQQLFHIPVSTDPGSSFSALNVQYEYISDSLVNKGSGRNYGVEISLERSLRNHFYLMLSNSFYQSKYTAADQKERNTAFNGNYIITLITGKDFLSERKNRTIGLNIKTIYAGGMRRTPVDIAASQQAGYSIYKEEQAFSLQNPAYFRADFRVSIQWNRGQHTSTLSLDLQNLTNRLNVFNQYYDPERDGLVTNYQTGIIPVLNYKIEF